MKLTPFHIAVQVRDIAEARRFYKDVLGCLEGRSDAKWVDFSLFGHQLVCHLNPLLGKDGQISSHYNPVDGDSVPVPHCGVVLEMHDWNELARRLQGHGVRFVIEPCIRFKGAPWGAGDAISARPVRQRARIQSLQGYCTAAVCNRRSRSGVVSAVYRAAAAPVIPGPCSIGVRAPCAAGSMNLLAQRVRHELTLRIGEDLVVALVLTGDEIVALSLLIHVRDLAARQVLRRGRRAVLC